MLHFPLLQPHEVVPATALSRAPRYFRTRFDSFALAGWKRTLVSIFQYKKHENRACVTRFDFCGSQYMNISKKSTTPSLWMGTYFTSCNNGPLKALFFDTSAIKMSLARQSQSGEEHFYRVYQRIFFHTPCARWTLCARSNKKACAKSSFVHVI